MFPPYTGSSINFLGSFQRSTIHPKADFVFQWLLAVGFDAAGVLHQTVCVQYLDSSPAIWPQGRGRQQRRACLFSMESIEALKFWVIHNRYLVRLKWSHFLLMGYIGVYFWLHFSHMSQWNLQPLQWHEPWNHNWLMKVDPGFMAPSTPRKQRKTNGRLVTPSLQTTMPRIFTDHFSPWHLHLGTFL